MERNKLLFSISSQHKLSTFLNLVAILGLGTSLIGIDATLAQGNISFQNQATYTYQNSANQTQLQGVSNQIEVNTLDSSLVDPFGQVLGCNGEPLLDYTGFSVSLYTPAANATTGTELDQLVPLTATELPDVAGNDLTQGVEPNISNVNPFSLSNTTQGKYSFLLDSSKGQLIPGTSYIFVVNPPTNSNYSQRRVKIEILANNNGKVSYRASSLDGQPITSQGQTQIDDTLVNISEANKQGVILAALQPQLVLCNPNQIEIIKTGDRAVAGPGDTVLYRLTVRSKSDATLNAIKINDYLPPGFKFLPNSVRGEFQGQPLSINATNHGNEVDFEIAANLSPQGVINLVYAAQLTPDSLRGSGENSAVVNAKRLDNSFQVKNGPVIHRLQINPGILSSCGTLLGRVFEDHNFDGEQQPGEPGIPNAVIVLEDGNRITTDTNGLFSVASVLPGYHTGTLDLTSVPDYTIAPNHYFRERNSLSRLVNLAPGGMVRMNFAVTKTN